MHSQTTRRHRESTATMITMITMTAVAFLLVLLSGSPSPGQESETTSRARPEAATRPLIPWPSAPMPIATWMDRNGWESKRHDPSRFTIQPGRLALVSRDDSVMIGTERGFPVDPRSWPRLRFELRVDAVPVGTDLARKSGDDAAFRIYVGFDEGGGLFSPPNTLAYTWTENVTAGRHIRSPHFEQLHYLSVGRSVTGGNAADESGWVTVEVDLVADYTRLFSVPAADVPKITGFVLKCDSNNTETSARAVLRRLELVGPSPAKE